MSNIQLYNGDCYQILKDMNTQIKVDAIITDIPYC